MIIECRTYHNGSYKEWKINCFIVKTVYHKGAWFNENSFNDFRQMLTPRR